MNRRSGVKMVLSVITAPIVLAHLIVYLNRRCHVNLQCSNIHPASLIRLAYSRYKHVCANTTCIVNVHVLSPYFLRFMEPRNRFQGINSASLCSLAGRYDNPIPTWFLDPIDRLKIPALKLLIRKADRMESWSRPNGRNSQRFAYSSKQCLFIKL
jgi:hypothetical protein